MGAILQFVVSGIDGRIDQIIVYKRAVGTSAFSVLAQIPLQAQYVDSLANFGDQYTYSYYDSVRAVESLPSPIVIYTNSQDAVSVSGFVSGIDALPFTQNPSYDAATFGGRLTVDVELRNDTSKMPIYDAQIIINPKQSVQVGTDGSFVLSLIPNNLIFPSNSYYKVAIGSRQFHKTVDSANGVTQLFSNLLDVNPFELR